MLHLPLIEVIRTLQICSQESLILTENQLPLNFYTDLNIVSLLFLKQSILFVLDVILPLFFSGSNFLPFPFPLHIFSLPLVWTKEFTNLPLCLFILLQQHIFPGHKFCFSFFKHQNLLLEFHVLFI